MRTNLFHSYLLGIWLSCCAIVHASPSPELLGSILGYPVSEIVVEDVTAQERETWSTPSAEERTSGTITSPPPQNLVVAYRVTGKDPRTFLPLTIWLAREGTFLTQEVKEMLEKLSQMDDGPTERGGRGQFGPFTFDGADVAGIYLGKMKTPSRSVHMHEPKDRTALMAVFHLPESKLEMRMAFRAAPDEGKLMPLPGGEAYFRSFGPSEDSNDRAWDLAGVFAGIGREVITSSAIAVNSHSSKSSGLTQRGSNPIKGEVAVSQFNSSESVGHGSGLRHWIWIALALVLLPLVVVILKRRA